MKQVKPINQHITLLKGDTFHKRKPTYCKGDVDTLLLGVNFRGESKHKSLICDYCEEKKSNYTYIEMKNHLKAYAV